MQHSSDMEIMVDASIHLYYLLRRWNIENDTVEIKKIFRLYALSIVTVFDNE